MTRKASRFVFDVNVLVSALLLADCIITGDGDLLVLNPFRQIPILTPTQFLASITR